MPSRLSSWMRGRAATTSKRAEDAVITAYPEESPGPPPGGFFYCCACLTHGSRRTAALSDCTRTPSGVHRPRSVQFTAQEGAVRRRMRFLEDGRERCQAHRRKRCPVIDGCHCEEHRLNRNLCFTDTRVAKAEDHVGAASFSRSGASRCAGGRPLGHSTAGEHDAAGRSG